MTEAYLDMSARIKRIPVPIASPGQCMICGKADHPLGFAATDNLDLEFYGTIYFCADCVGDYARLFGYMSREQIEDLIEKQKRTDEELVILRGAVANLENILDAYSRLRPDSGIPDYRTIGDVVASEAPNEGASEAASEPVSSNDSSVSGSVTAGEGQSESTTEPVDEQGRDDLRDSASPNIISLFDDLGL